MVARPVRKRMYRTMQGRMVDIEKLRATNEGVRAVGNMNVNARGDVLGLGGSIIKSKESVMREYYEAPKGRASDVPTRKISRAPRQTAPVAENKVITPQPKQVQGQTTKFKPKAEVVQPAEKKGIDAALDGIE